MLGVIRPTVEEAHALTKNNKIAVIGTESTVDAASYPKEIAHLNSDIIVSQESCPMLVPLVENFEEGSKRVKDVLGFYLEAVKRTQADTLILGCTHYSWLRDDIQLLLDNKIQIVDSADIVAHKLKEYLSKHSEYDKPAKEPKVQYLTTGDTQVFDASATHFLNKNIKSQLITLN